MYINTLVTVVTSVLTLYAITSFVLWLSYRHCLLKLMMVFWGSGILVFLSQGFFSGTNTPEFLAFCANWLTVIFLLKIFSTVLQWELPYRLYNGILLFSVAISLCLFLFNFSYAMSSLAFCLACAGIIIHASFFRLKVKNYNSSSTSYKIIMFLYALHFLAYPFFRSTPEYSSVGLLISLCFFIGFTLFIPILILRKIFHDYNMGLQTQIELRTEELRKSNSHLQEVLEALKSKNEQIDLILHENQTRMAALIHDLTNPLSVLFYNINMNLSETLPQHLGYHTQKEKLRRAIQTVEQLLKDARSTHRHSLGKMQISLKKIFLDTLVKDVLDAYDGDFAKKQITVNFDSQTLKKYCVLVNDTWLKNHVLSNLISNSIKFSHPGGRISVRASEDKFGNVSLYVEDEGIGILKENQGKIFNLRQAITSHGTLGESGSGFGLPIAKRYMELMGGHIRIVKTKKPGTCFELTLRNAA